jgi:ABC-type uncharacterized transport system involved in gliding motility auxiliary subunit
MLQRIFGIIGWIGTALVFGAIAIRFFRPEWDQYAIYAAWAGLACVVLYTLGQWREIIAYFKGRNARYGAIASVSVIVVLGILGFVNYLSQQRFNKRWDLTANQQYSLSEQSIKLLQNLDAPVTFRVFDQSDALDGYRSRLAEYEYQSNQVSAEYIDMDQQPGQAKQANVDTYGTILIQYKDRTERVNSNTEQDLTNGLIKVLTGTTRKVYFSQGHGEKDTADSQRAGYSTISDALAKSNYAVEKLVLAQQKDVPDDAAVVIIAGLRSDLLPQEADMLRRYLAKGGHLLVMLDPPDPQSGAPMPNIEGLLKEWSVDAANNIVIDASGVGQIFGGDASVPVAATYAQHPITDRFNLLTAYPLARSVAPTQSATEGRVAQTIIETSARSWAETDLKASGEVALNPEAGDKPGPVSIGVAVTAPVATDTATPAPAENPQGEQPPKPESRLAVVGDSDFAANFALGIQGNRDLFLNMVNWLAQQENLIAIRARQADDRRITLTAESARWIMLMSIFIIPAMVFATGVYTWWRRR